LVGGNAFGNETNWITDAIKRALMLYDDWDIDVVIVSYSSSKRQIQDLAEQFP